ncbi:transposase [Pseudonocardia sp. S2-4]|uniref:Transposase n=1 Tax=Pseudonocardia humida TaxID=2800819 RepID=A0ABT1A2G9_9PSEU|nr:transposase [Pseudonocardia humida]
MFLPESWDDTRLDETADPALAEQVRQRRARAGIDDQVRHREKWRLALDMLDQLTDWGLPARPLVADAGNGDATEFRLALTDRDLPYVLAASPTATAHR